MPTLPRQVAASSGCHNLIHKCITSSFYTLPVLRAPTTLNHTASHRIPTGLLFPHPLSILSFVLYCHPPASPLVYHICCYLFPPRVTWCDCFKTFLTRSRRWNCKRCGMKTKHRIRMLKLERKGPTTICFSSALGKMVSDFFHEFRGHRR